MLEITGSTMRTHELEIKGNIEVMWVSTCVGNQFGGGAAGSPLPWSQWMNVGCEALAPIFAQVIQ